MYQKNKQEYERIVKEIEALERRILPYILLNLMPGHSLPRRRLQSFFSTKKEVITMTGQTRDIQAAWDTRRHL